MARPSSFTPEQHAEIARLYKAGAPGRRYLHLRRRVQYLVYRGAFQVAAVRDWLYQDATVWLPRKRERLESYGSGKRRGYPTRARYVCSTSGTVSRATIQAYIDAQKCLG